MSLFDKVINKKLFTYSVRNTLNEMAKKQITEHQIENYG